MFLDDLPLWFDPDGVCRGPAGDGRVALISRADVGAVSAAVLAADGYRNETLDLSGNVIGDDGAAALADSLFFGRLRRLDLSNNRVGDPGALALAASPHAATLGQLVLAKNPIAPAGTAALREKFGGRVHVLG